MTPLDTQKDLGPEFATALAEHRELLATIADIEARLARPVNTDEWRHDLGRRVRELDRELARHFAVEERKGGFFEALRVHFPQLSPKLDARLAEHPGLLDRFAEVSRRLAAPGNAHARGLADLLVDLRRDVIALKLHESAENAMLQLAYGAGDEEAPD
jgi:hypothetical protein